MMGNHNLEWDGHNIAWHERSGLLHRDSSIEYVAERCAGQLCYLATPYTKPSMVDGSWNSLASDFCSAKAGAVARVLAHHGVTAISPIVQSDSMLGLDYRGATIDPLDEVFWEAWCRPLLKATGPVIVPPLKGWRESQGVWHEVQYALSANRTVFLISGEAI